MSRDLKRGKIVAHLLLFFLQNAADYCFRRETSTNLIPRTPQPAFPILLPCLEAGRA